MSQFEIIFVRHGEAESSFGTHPDPALSKNGIKQSLKLLSIMSYSHLKIIFLYQAQN